MRRHERNAEFVNCGFGNPLIRNAVNTGVSISRSDITRMYISVNIKASGPIPDRCIIHEGADSERNNLGSMCGRDRLVSAVQMRPCVRRIHEISRIAYRTRITHLEIVSNPRVLHKCEHFLSEKWNNKIVSRYKTNASIIKYSIIKATMFMSRHDLRVVSIDATYKTRWLKSLGTI